MTRLGHLNYDKIYELCYLEQTQSAPLPRGRDFGQPSGLHTTRVQIICWVSSCQTRLEQP